jgi:dipeptidyl-peptidase-4
MKVATHMSLIIIAVISLASPAQEQDSSLLTVERIFSTREFFPQRFGPARWLADGSGYTTLEPSQSQEGANDIVKYDPATNARQVLVPAEWLVPAGSKEPLGIDDYSWSDDGARLLIFTNTKRVWRSNTRGDYWVLNLAGHELKKLGGGFEESTLMFAKFSPDGGRVGYVVKNNIYVEELSDGAIKQLTSDGSETIINGTFDWVYEEELGLRDGFRWSPDGTKIAFWQLDASGIQTFYMINNTDSLYPRLIPVQYPKAGTTNSASKLGVVEVDTGAIRWFDLPDARMHYIARMEWADNSKEIIFQRLNRLQNTNEVILGDVETGETRTVFTDSNDTWVEVCDDLVWLNGGTDFTWLSERDGWNHVYRISRSGDEIKLLTPGEFDVIGVASIDEASGRLYLIASPDNPTQRYLYSVPLDGSGTLKRLTPVTFSGSNNYNISPGAKWAFHTWSNVETPPVTSLVSLPEHKDIRTMVANEELRKKIEGIKHSLAEFFRIDIGDGVQLDAWCIKPPDFDPAKRYPLFFYVYGEPAGQTVLDRWGGNTYFWHLMLAQRGYVVMSVDNRGTPAPRGRDWRKCIYKQIGVVASQDQAAAAKAICKRFEWIDPERIGIWGWSGGGSMTLNMMFRYPEIYKTGLAVAAVSDLHYYDTIYQERYMGLPADSEESYRNGSPITFANKLEGNLLIVHGTGDDNVHYQNCEALINELVSNNKRFTMMAYPNRSHGIFEGKNTTLHLFTLLTDYLTEHLPPGPR